MEDWGFGDVGEGMLGETRERREARGVPGGRVWACTDQGAAGVIASGTHTYIDIDTHT